MNQTAELVVGCFGIVHVIELRDVYKTSMSVYKKGGTATIRPLHLMCEGLFLFAEEFVRDENLSKLRTRRKKAGKAQELRTRQKNSVETHKF